MNADDHVRARLRDAEDLTAILAAAHDAFEWMLPVMEGHEDPAGAMFAAFVTAGAAAADGRDAMAFAPSCPALASRTPGSPAAARGPSAAPAPDPGSTAGNAAAAIAAVCVPLAARLAEAGSSAPGRRDQIACADAARYASKIRLLLTGRGP